MTYPEPSERYHKVIFWLVVAVVFAMLAATIKGAEPKPTPPPWCVNIKVVDSVFRGMESRSWGSGSLVSPSLVITNNHVVRDRKNDDSVTVYFPNGDEVAGKVIKTDKTLDLAAIRVPSSLKPYVLLRSAPLRMGETLTIHGYGDGYQSASGVIEMFPGPVRGSEEYVRITGAASTDGDSGGPMVCENGELGGVLFGSSGNTTTGIRLRAVRKFIESVK